MIERARTSAPFVQDSGTWKVQQEGNIRNAHHTYTLRLSISLFLSRVPFKGPMESSTRSVNKGQGTLHCSSTRYIEAFKDSLRLSAALSAVSTAFSPTHQLATPYVFLFLLPGYPSTTLSQFRAPLNPI